MKIQKVKSVTLELEDGTSYVYELNTYEAHLIVQANNPELLNNSGYPATTSEVKAEIFYFFAAPSYIRNQVSEIVEKLL